MRRRQKDDGPVEDSQYSFPHSSGGGGISSTGSNSPGQHSVSSMQGRRMSLFVTNRRMVERRMSDSLFQLDPRMEEATSLGAEHVNPFTLCFLDRELESEYVKFQLKEMSDGHWHQFSLTYMLIGVAVYLPVMLLKRWLYEKSPNEVKRGYYNFELDLVLLTLAWILPHLLNIFTYKVLKKRDLLQYCSLSAVFFNWIASGVGILGHWYFVDKAIEPTAPFAFYLPALFAFHIFTFIPFKLGVSSVFVLVLNYLFLAWMNEYYLIETFLYVTISIVVTSCLIVYICYQQEKSNREQFLNSQRLNKANLKLVNQLKNLQLSYGRKALDFDSPLEKVTSLVRSLLADSSISPNQLDTLNMIINLLNASNLFAPDLDNQVKGGKLKMDIQQEKWLFSEIVKRNPTLLNSRKRKSVTNLHEYQQENGAGRKHSSSTSISQDISLLKGHLNVLYNVIEQCMVGGLAKSKFGGSEVFCQTLEPVLSQIDDLNFPIFTLQDASHNHPLLISSLYLFQRFQMYSNLNIKESKFCRFIMSIEAGYRSDIPYHTSTHAADVLHAMYYFCTQSNVKHVVTDFDLACLFTSAIIHDFDHPGVNNNFLASVLDFKAILYNDRSILENHHLARSFEILIKPDNNFTENFTLQEFKDFRTCVVDSVLATDLAMHFQILSKFKSRTTSADSKFSPDVSKEDNSLLFNVMMKCADVCNSSKELGLHKRWVNLVLEEFFLQGDRERALGLDISPLMDRQKVDIPSSQTGFIDFICTPLYEAFHNYADIGKVIEGIEKNRRHWSQEKENDDNDDDDDDDDDDEKNGIDEIKMSSHSNK